VQRTKFAPHARPGRFLTVEPPMGSIIGQVLLDNGQVTQSQSLDFGDTPQAPTLASFAVPTVAPTPPWMPVCQLKTGDVESKDEDQ
jgi:hypothetical protein